MAFTHGKNGRLWVDNFELTQYFNEFAMQAKAGTADVTCFGQGAKTYIGGIQEGTLTAKGLFGSATTDTADAELTAALGRSNNFVITFSPTGKTVAGTRVVVSEAAETDYSVSAPVSGAVATSMSAQADSGLSTGVVYYDPTTAALVTSATTNGTGISDTGATDTPTTAVTVASNGTNVSTYTGAGVLSATNPIVALFATTGYLSVVTSSGVAILSYTGTTSTTFTGVTTVSGTGTVSTGAAIVAPFYTQSGFVFVAHVFTLTGTGSPSVTITMQHSDDSATWSTLATFTAITAVGGYFVTVPANTQCLRFVRAQIVTAGSTISTTLGISGARQ